MGESETCCIQILGETLPEHLLIYRTVNPVQAYIPGVRLCYKCGQIGHISKGCTKDTRCLNCSGNHGYNKDTPCKTLPKCLNCTGQYRTTDRTCPIYARHLEVARVMVMDNLPYFEAKASVMRNERSASGPLHRLKQ